MEKTHLRIMFTLIFTILVGSILYYYSAVVYPDKCQPHHYTYEGTEYFSELDYCTFSEYAIKPGVEIVGINQWHSSENIIEYEFYIDADIEFPYGEITEKHAQENFNSAASLYIFLIIVLLWIVGSIWWII